MNDLYDMLKNIHSVCDNHDVIFEINSMNIIIRKYFYHNGKPYNYNQAFTFEIFKYKDIDFCISEFEKRLKLYIGGLNNE